MNQPTGGPQGDQRADRTDPQVGGGERPERSEPAKGTPEFWALHRPDTPAVIHGDVAMTYGQWNDRADRVAEGLAALGLGKGDRLGLRFRLCPEWFVMSRALLKLGMTSVAVNWKLTAAEAAYIVTDSGAAGLACNDRDPNPWFGVDLGRDDSIVVTVGQAAGTPGVRYEDLVATANPQPRFGARRTSMVLYTSGTTGAPRGVAPPDKAAMANRDRLTRYGASVGAVPPYPRDASVLLTLPVHHGAGPAVANGTCLRGGTIVLLDPYDPEEALRLIAQHRVQVWSTVPTMLQRIRSLPAEVFDRYDLSSLQAVSVGAAAVPQPLKEWVVERFPSEVLWESYGCSEAGMISYLAPQWQLTKPGSSGQPFDGVDIAIVDDEWNRLPTGETGEIAVSTPFILSGYLGREPLGDDVVRDGFYRTGDVGHVDADGFLYITDRIKDMIVAGGVNIYPAEVEEALAAHPGIERCAVIGIPNDDFGEEPMAFVVPVAGETLTEAAVVDFLDGRIAPFKRPRSVTFVDDLPINPMGKILKNQLRAPYWEGRDRSV